MPQDETDPMGAAKSNTRFRAYAKALSYKLPDGTPLSDHTWASTDEPGVCWPALGGTDKSFYCGPKRWSDGKYTPPKGSRLLPENGTGSIQRAKYLGDPMRTTFMKIPCSAGIVYAVHGVCHEITNRILYHTGATVRQAKQYNVTKAFYGVYGTSIPAFVWLTALAPVATAVQAKICWDWKQRKKKSGKLKMAQPGERSLPMMVDDLHDRLDAAELITRSAQIDAHQAEIELMLRDELGDAISDAEIREMQSVYAHLDRRADIPQQASDTVPLTAAPEFDPVELAMQAKPHVKEAMNGFADAIGTKNYTTLFGQQPGDYVSFINPEMFRA
ncbi:hypothetical protein [Sulfitobacter sabulilitoris]|uniref:Uncharacterized protein n=1 Tax=Sulfitobacter sabulilitoris TaxID=2562655 RepID=A0A5S3PP92_9RHOB|nr:hypothetical protein [Sulfitobacter sabulilitoris]TMM54335.1 hypothetical protein FDT80_01705 [Sulfitobacter sabulilitoris]